MIKSFTQFLNEVELSRHWKSERTSLSNPMSRIVPYSMSHQSGWTCDTVIRMNEKGEPQGKTRLSELLSKSGMTQEEFNRKVSVSMKLLFSGKKLADTNYQTGARIISRKMYIGKLAFKVGNDYYSPELTVTTARNQKVVGNCFYAAVLGNLATTVLYYPENVSDKELMHGAYLSYMAAAKKGEPGHDKNMSEEEFAKDFRVERPFGNFILVIPDSENWEREVEKQANGTSGDIRTVELKREARPDEKFKQMEIKKDSLVGYYITDKFGEQRLVVRRVISARTITNDEIRTKKDYFSKLNISPLPGNDTKQGIFMELADASGTKVGKVLVRWPGNKIVLFSKKKEEETRKALDLPMEGELAWEISMKNVSSSSGVPSVAGDTEKVFTHDLHQSPE